MAGRLTVMAIAWAAALSFAAAPVGQEPPPTAYRPPPPPEQPIAFSHQSHVAQALSCTSCHEGAATADQARLPATATCMGCHATVRAESLEVQKLAGFHARGEDVPWRRVYRLPTFVWFSHSVHAPADKSMTCETCHGPVSGMTVMQKVKDTSMAACVQCHTERSAPVRCDSCHEAR
jgi:predicted CXXCH cytochrome family protein